MSSINVGSVQVSVVPDTSRFAQRLKADLSRLPDVMVNVDADVKAAAERIQEVTRDKVTSVAVDVQDSAAKAKVTELTRDRVANVSVDIQDAAAKAKLAELSQQIKDKSFAIQVDTAAARVKIIDLKQQIAATEAAIKVNADDTEARAKLVALKTQIGDARLKVEADTAAAKAEILALRAEANSTKATINVDVDTGAAEAKIAAVGASASGAGGSMSGLLAAGLALGPGIIPVAGAAAVAILGIGSAALSAGPALGALFLGFSGVSAAVGAMGKADASSAATGAAAAASRVAQANAIAGAQASLANAQRSAAASAVSAAQAVIDAERGVVDARRSAGQAVASAVQQQITAEQSLATAQDGERQAQLALTQARISAKQSIEDLTNSVADGALSQRAATLNVQQARLAMANLGPNATLLQRQQAQLAYDQAVQQVTDLSTRQSRLVESKKAADKAGVEGSAGVISAQQNVAKSIAGTAAAQSALGRAESAVTEARRAGAEKVTVAQEAVSKALIAQGNSAASSAASVASAQRALQQAMATTATSGSASMSALDQAMKNLSPAGRDFAKFIYSLRPEFDKLKATAQGGLLPGVTDFLKDLKPLMPVFTEIIGNASKALGDLFREAGKALQAPFWQDFFHMLATTVGPNIKIFGEILGDLATGFAGLLTAFTPVGDTVMGVIAGLAKSFADWAKSLAGSSGFKAFMAYMAENGPKVWGLLKDLLKVAGDLIVGLAPLGAVILDVLSQLASTLAKMSPEQITLIAVAIGAIATALSGQWVALAVIAVAGLVTGFIDWYNHSKTLRDFVNNHLVPGLKDLWGFIRDKLIPVLKKDFQDAWDGVKIAVGFVTDAFKDNKGEMKQLRDAFKGFADFMTTKWLPLMGPVLKAIFTGLGALIAFNIRQVGFWVDAYTTLRDVVGKVLKFIVTNFIVMAGGVVHAAAIAFGWMPDLGDKLKTASDDFDTFAKNVMDSLNGITPKDVQVKAKFMVGNGDGGSVIPGIFTHAATGGPMVGPGTGTSDSIPAMLSHGEHVLTAADVTAAGGHAAIFAYRKALHGFAGGGIVTATPGYPAMQAGANDAWRGMLAHTKLDLSSLAGAMGGGGTSVMGGGMAGSGVQRWLPIVLQALGLTGQSPGLAQTLLRRMNQESGGNQFAINNWDSNAQRGDPSRGLMQTIMSTFNAYRMPGLSSNIYDPLSNIVASIRYALRTYGSLSSAYNRAGGYAQGGPVRPYGFDKGGYLMPGATGHNTSATPERVLTGQQTQSFDRLVGILEQGNAAGGGDELLTQVIGLRSDIRALPRDYKLGQRQYA
jgi:hypothetical protein